MKPTSSAASGLSRAESWHAVSNLEEIASPALLVYPERVEENILRMIRMAGGVSKLRPHVKTHKQGEIIRMQLKHGIGKVKCATVAEAELAAGSGVEDVLLAYQPVGPGVKRLMELARAFPGTRFSTILDDGNAAEELARGCVRAGLSMEILLDIDVGMGRSGIRPGKEAIELYGMISKLAGLEAAGLHVYDGHIRESEAGARKEACEAAWRPVERLAGELAGAGLTVRKMVAGGSPTFPIHARREGVECSPGTCLLWDAGYGRSLADLEFLVAALVLTRVVSKPGEKRLCLDLGHKAIGSEGPHPRVELLGLPEAKAVMHSEEHLVIETERAKEYRVGAAFFGIPWHICPTCALYAEAVAVEGGRAERRWKVARERALTI